MTVDASQQTLGDIDGRLLVWSTAETGTWDIGFACFGGSTVLLTNHPATQADPTISGNLILWEDNRSGTYDIYGTYAAGFAAPAAGEIVINEVLADPGSLDANGDGSASATEDEFVEIVNVTDLGLDVSGMTLSDGVSVRHTFPPGTVIPAGAALVVFGGGSIDGFYGGASVQFASSGSLGLNNDGDTVTLSLGGTIIDTMTYGREGGAGQSLVRVPEYSGPFSQHASFGTAHSAGMTIDGFGH